MARKLKKKLPKAQSGLVGSVTRGLRNRLSKIAPSIFPTPTPPSILGPMKTIKVGTNPSLSLDDWRSYIKTGNVDSPFPAFYSEKARQHIVPSFAPVDEFGTIGLTGDLVRKESNRFNNLVFDRGLMIAPAQGTGRKSVHFTGTGKPVPGHLLGNWDHVTNTFTLPISDAIRYNAMPRSTAPNDVYFYNPRQFVYPPSTKILTGDMQLATNARGIGLDVNFNKELFKLNKQLNKIEELKNTPGTKYSYNESTSTGNFNSDKYNLYKKDREPLVRQVKKLTDDWLTGLNLQGIDHLNPAYKLGFRDFDPNLRSDLQRNIRSSSQTPYVHSESPEFKYYMEGLTDSSGKPLVKSRSQRIDENPSLIFDDVTMEQAKDPKYSLFDNARIYKGGYEKAGMVEPSQADLILYQKQIFSYPKEYVEKILANYDAKNFPKDGPYRKILENYIKDGSAGVKYDEGGETDKNTITYSRLLKRFIPSAAVIAKNPLLTFTGAMLYPNTLGKGSTLETPSLEQQYQNYLNFTTPEERIKSELEYEVMTGKPFTFDPQPLPNQQHGGSLPKAQDGTGSLNPQYQAIIYYNPDDPNDYFTADLERMTPELNQRYGEGNWIARPIPNFAFTDEYKSLLKELEENPFIIKHKKEMSALRKKGDQIRYDIEKERKANNFNDYKTEKQMELEKQLQTLNEEIEILANQRKPITYSDKDYYYNQTKGEYKLLDDVEFESEDHKNYIINSIKRQNLEREKKDILSSVDSTNKYFQDIKNLSPTGDIIIMQHGTAKVGPIMMSEAERDSFQYDQTPGITDTFAEVINENFDDPSGITCYMGMCKQSDSGQRLANATGMKVNVASGDQWSGYQTGFGDTFIDRFFGTGNTLIDPVTSQPYNYGYDTYGPFINEQDPDAVDEAFYDNYLNSLDIFNENITPENRQHGGGLPKAQSGLFKSITNPLGRIRYKIDPFDVTPKSRLLLPSRSYGDVQHKIPSLISQFQRKDTPMLANLIMPRSNLETGDLFSTGMGDRIRTFLSEGQKVNEPFKLMDGNTRFWLGEQMGKNWDDQYRIIQSENKNLFPEIDKFNLRLSKRPDGSLAWFKPDGKEYTDIDNAIQSFPSLIGRDKTSPATLFQGPRLIKDRADLENQFNIRNTAYHTVNITDGLRNNEIIRSQAKKYGFNPDDDRELAMFLGTSPGGSGRRGGYSTPEGYDILFSGNNPVTTLERYGNLRATPFTVQFNLMDAMAPRLQTQKGKTFGAYPQLNAPGNKMPIGSHGLYASDLGLYDRISAFDTKNSNFPQFGIASPFSYNTQLGMSTFKKGLNPDDYQGLIINPNSLQVPGLTQTNLIFGKENVPVRMAKDIFTPDEVFKMRKEYGGQTPGLALDDTPDRTYKDGGATRTSLSQYQNGGGPNYNQMLIQFIKDQEAGMEYMKAKNSAVMKPDGSGYYKRYEDGKFYPYYHQNADGSFESEATIGYGTKGLNIYDMYKEGMSVPEANISLNKSLNDAHRKTKIYVDANYGEGFYDNLSDQKKAMLADFTYNLGRLSKYPKFAEGILTDNTDLALAEYIRGEEKGGAELGRNKAYLEIFLQPWVDQTLERKKKEEEEEKLRLLNQKRDNIMEEKYSSWYSPFVPNSIENLFKQNYDWEDQYWKDKGITTYQDGGQYSNDALRLFSNYQGMLQSSFSEDLRNDVAKTYIDALKREGIDVENMSQGQMFNIARAAQEAGYSMPFQEYDTKFGKTNVPQFMYKGKPFGIEEYDDPVNIFRTKEEFDNILKLAQSIPTSYFTNKDIKTEEDYEKAIFDYFGEEGTVPNSLVSRFLRDVKKAGNIGELSYMQSIPKYNLMRNIMNPEYDEDYKNILTEQKLLDFFDSKEFNQGTKAFKEWEKRYNATAMNAFNDNYLSQIVGYKGSKERNAFDEYVANNPDGGDNEFYEAIRTGMQASADLYDVTNIPTTYTTPAGLLGTGESTVDYSTFAEGDVPYYMKDARMAAIQNILYPSGQILDPDFNQYENRPKTRFEKSAITKNWDNLGNYLKYDAFHLGPSGGKNMFNFVFGDLLYGTVDWAAKTAGGVLGIDGDKYEAYERFVENPTPGTFGMLGLDVVSFVPVGKGAKLLTGLKNTNKSAQFLTKGISNTPGWQNKTNLLYNNLDDLTNLHSLKKAPPTGPFSSISTGTTFNPQFNLGTFNKPKYTPFRESGFLKTPYQIGIIGGGAGTNVLEQYNPNYFENLINSTENNN